MWPFRSKQPEQKSAVPSGFSYVLPFGGGAGMQRNAEAYAREGYSGNVVAHTCIRKIATSAANVGLQLQKGDNADLVEKHPVLDLLARPNLVTSRSRFFEALITWRLTAGDAFVVRLPWGESKPSKGKPTQLWLLEPHKMTVKADILGMPSAYEYRNGTDKLAFPVDQTTGACDVAQFSSINLLDRSRGLSPMAPAAFSVDTHTSALRWNKALLDNAGRPSGALVMMKNTDGSTGSLTDEQYARLKEGIEEQYSGIANAGRPILLEGGLDWKEMSLSPTDMDFGNGKNSAANDICMAYGVPPQLIGLPGSQTFANYEQAVETFWEDTVLPLLDDTLGTLNHWLLPMFGAEGLQLSADRDSISALEPVRQMKYQRIDKVSFLSTNEKRIEAGFDEADPNPTNPADMILVPANVMPLDMVGADLTPDDQTIPEDSHAGGAQE
ncbi:MAG: phage portal protein [Acetobacteraceae bacterium]